MDYKILVDTREKEIKHIIEKFDKNKIPYEFTTIKTGDYLIKNLDKNEVYNSIAIERKADLNELINNLLDRNSIKEITVNGETKKLNRFYRELERSKEQNIKLIIIIEDENFYYNMLKGNYKSNTNINSLKGMLMSLEAKYPNINIVGINKNCSASYINATLYYNLRQHLKISNQTGF
ncbi:MAG: ERCC4 domain-containing protein [Peptostreptococcaceae bacterium]